MRRDRVETVKRQMCSVKLLVNLLIACHKFGVICKEAPEMSNIDGWNKDKLVKLKHPDHQRCELLVSMYHHSLDIF